MEQVQEVLSAVLSYFQAGFYRVNGVQGLLIAAVFAYMMPRWGRLLVTALGAVVAHAVLDVMVPVLARSAAFQLPPLVEIEDWKYLLSIYAGYLIVISVFFLVKSLLLRGGH